MRCRHQQYTFLVTNREAREFRQSVALCVLLLVYDQGLLEQYGLDVRHYSTLWNVGMVIEGPRNW